MDALVNTDLDGTVGVELRFVNQLRARRGDPHSLSYIFNFRVHQLSEERADRSESA